MLTYSLLKAPLLLGLAVNSYRGMTPPLRPPRPNEKKRASAPDFLAGLSNVQRVVIGATKVRCVLPLIPASSTNNYAYSNLKVTFCTLTLTKASLLVVQQMSPSSILHGSLFTLIPRSLLSADTSSLRLTPVAVAGCLIGALGGFIRVWCHRTLGRFFTWEVAVRDDHKLIIEGPYNIVRHPSYTGWYCVIAGNLLLLYSKGSLFVESGLLGTLVGKAVAACMTVYMGWVCAGMLYRTKTEDELLRKEFGTEWDEWARKTPYRLIPGVY